MSKLKLGMVGGGQGAFIGSVHRIASRIDDHYELVAGSLASNPEVAVTVEMEGFYRSMDMTREDTSAFMHHLYQLQTVTHKSGGNENMSPLDEDSPETRKREKLLRKISNHE